MPRSRSRCSSPRPEHQILEAKASLSSRIHQVYRYCCTFSEQYHNHPSLFFTESRNVQEKCKKCKRKMKSRGVVKDLIAKANYVKVFKQRSRCSRPRPRPWRVSWTVLDRAGWRDLLVQRPPAARQRTDHDGLTRPRTNSPHTRPVR